jgi:RNA polymerase sigma factor (sigma-70 family)
MAATLPHLLHHFRQLAPPDADAVLLQRFAHDRDETAFRALVERHGPMVLGVCRRVLQDAHAAEDAFQATFLVLARKSGGLRRPSTLAAWLYGVARRVALKARGRWRRPSVDAADVPDPRPDPLVELSARDLLAAVNEEIERLPERNRLPVVLCCLEGLSQEEAAQRLGWRPGSVKGRLERGRKRLQARLTRRGLTLSAVLAAAAVARGGPGRSVLLAGPTAEAALTFSANGTKAAVPAGAAAMANEVLRAMIFTRMKAGAGVLLLTALLGLGAGEAALHQSASQEPGVSQYPGKRPAAAAPAPGQPAPLELTAKDDGKVVRAVVGQIILVRLEYPTPKAGVLADGGTGASITPGKCARHIPNVDVGDVRRLKAAGLIGPNTALFQFRAEEPGMDELAIRVWERASNRVRDFAVTLDVRPPGEKSAPPAPGGKGRTPAEMIRAATAQSGEGYPVLPSLSTEMRGKVAGEIAGSAAVRAAYAKLNASKRNATWFDGVKELEKEKAVWCLTACLCHPHPDVQIHALRALAGLKDRRAVSFLVLYAEYMAVLVEGSENATIHGIIHAETARALSELTGVRVTLRGQDPEGLKRGVRRWQKWLCEQPE